MINIKADSRKVKKGDIFVALRTVEGDGHLYIDSAIKNGASKLIVDHEVDSSVPYVVVPDTRKYLEDYLIENYSYVNEMNIVGITGTNGKTTTAYLIEKALNKINLKTAYIGTLGYYIDTKIESLPNTSPDICEMYELLVDAYDKGCKNVIIEASSQGLVRGRLKGIKYTYCIYTNLTQDHLDEHKTMENYALAKRIMFDNIKDTGTSIINIDDKHADLYKTNNTVYYGFNNGDFKVIDANYTNRGTDFKYSYLDKEYSLHTKLLGDYNIYNIMAMVSLFTLMGIDANNIKELVETSETPDGRLDIVSYKTNSIIIDYAHTEDAMNNVFKVAKLITKGNIYLVFGCTGDRDRTKRPVMLDLACTNSKQVIITSDDLHNEAFDHIVNDMLENNKHDNYEIIEDRKEAIKKGISFLKEDDTLLILGKGHEDYIIVGRNKIPHNDKKFVLEVLANL